MYWVQQQQISYKGHCCLFIPRVVKETSIYKSLGGTVDIAESNLNAKHNCNRKRRLQHLLQKWALFVHFSAQTEQIGSLITYQRGVLIKQSSLSGEREDRH